MRNLLFLLLLLLQPSLFAEGFSDRTKESLSEPSKTETDEGSLQEELNKRLVQACKEGDLQGVKRSLAAGAEIDGKSDFTNHRGTNKNVTPLIIAILQKHTAIADYLIDKGADTNHTYSMTSSKNKGDIKNITPLFISLGMRDRKIFKKLLLIGAKTDAILQGEVQGMELNSTSLFGMCLLLEKKDCIESLLLFQADMNIPMDMVQKSMNIKMKHLYPLHFVVMGGEKKLTRMILLAGADVDVTTDITLGKQNYMQGMTPLMVAADKGNVALLKMLLLFGARLDAQASGKMRGESIDGYTALDFARKKKRSQAVKLLEQALKQQDNSSSALEE